MYNNIFHGDNDLSKSSFLITGGAGFIGSNLVEYLLKYGVGKVRVLDNFSTGFTENVEPFYKFKNFELIKGDIRDQEVCHKAMIGIDYVLHQAALGSVPRSIEDPSTTNEVNVSGFLNILVAARDAKVKRMIYAASSSTYGDSKNMPKVEDVIGNPLSPYAVTKLVNELYANVFSKTYNMELIGLRYFNVFGPRQNTNGAYAAVIPKFIKALLQFQSPVINGDGSVTRDFTYIENIVQINIRSVFTTNPLAINQVFNAACGQRISLLELLNHIKEHLSTLYPDSKLIEPIFKPVRVGDIPDSLASIEKAQKLLDYHPEYTVIQGIK
ncbi:MAG: SDR family oxidoreductase, partial [Flavobacterium sp.]